MRNLEMIDRDWDQIQINKIEETAGDESDIRYKMQLTSHPELNISQENRTNTHQN